MVWWVRLQFLFPGFGFFFNDSCAQAEAQNPGANAETKPSIQHLAAYQWLFPSLLLAPLQRGHSSSFRLLEFDRPIWIKSHEKINSISAGFVFIITITIHWTLGNSSWELDLQHKKMMRIMMTMISLFKISTLAEDRTYSRITQFK